MPVVSHTLTRPGGAPMADEVIHIRLLASAAGEGEGFVASTQTGILSEYKLRTDSTGTWSVTLTANALITPANTTYQVIQPGITGGKVTETFIVPNGGGPYWLGDILAAAPVGLPGYALDLHDADLDAHPGTLERIVPAAEKVIYVSPLGLDANDGLTKATPKLTFAAALAAIGTGNTGHINMGHGSIAAGAGISLNGYKATFSGRGDGTILQATAQTGPVLDFTGYVAPGFARDIRPIGGFQVRGDGTAGTAKVGVKLTAQVFGMVFRDISVRETGGIPWLLEHAKLNEFYNIILAQPISAEANNVAYMHFEGSANGNLFVGLGFRNPGMATDPAGGVVTSSHAVAADAATYVPASNEFVGCWTENIRVPTGGVVLNMRTNTCGHSGWRFFDTIRVSGATGTAFVRFLAPASGPDLGGNYWRGIVPGGNTPASSIEQGIELGQSRNSVIGVRGFNGRNVRFLSGTQYNFVELGGMVSGVAPAALNVQDDSGNTTNQVLDHTAHSLTWGDVTLYRSSADTWRTEDAIDVMRASATSPAHTSRTPADAVGRHSVLANGRHEWGNGTDARDTNLYRSNVDLLRTDDKFVAVAGLGAGNTVAATTPGSVVRKMEVFNELGTSLGFIPIYGTIT